MVAYEDLFFFFAIRDQLAGDWQLTAGLDAGYQSPLWPIIGHDRLLIIVAKRLLSAQRRLPVHQITYDQTTIPEGLKIKGRCRPTPLDKEIRP